MDFTNHQPVINVAGAGIDLGEALPAKVREDVRKVGDKYFGRLLGASVHFARQGHLFRCRLNVQVAGIETVSAEGDDKDVYKAFGSAIDKAGKQLRRLKRHLVDDKPVGVSPSLM